MARITALVVLAAAALVSNALHIPRADDHAALAARLAVRAPVPVPESALDAPAARLTRRARRCAAQVPVSVSVPAAGSSSTGKPAASAGGATNVAPKPTVVTSSVTHSSAPAAPAPDQSPSSSSKPPATTARPVTTLKPTPTPTPTSSSRPAPPSSSSSSKPPATSSAAPPPPKTTSTPPPASNSGSCGANSLTGTMSGDGTYYGTGLGACGFTNNDNEPIVAVSKLLYDTFPGYAGPGTNPNNNPICGKMITAHFGGNSVRVKVVDRCEACACGSLDFSPSAFRAIADMDLGRIHGVTWSFD